MKKIENLIYPELSYKIVGLVYDVHNTLGGGLREKVYEKALVAALTEAGFGIDRQLLMPIIYKEKKIANRYLDILVDKKVVIELKAGERFTATYIQQVCEYLKHSGLRLGLLVNFGKERVTIKRVVNDY
jgi:GxxExxY protein